MLVSGLNKLIMPKPRDKSGLTDKQKRFTKEYLANGHNGKRAAIAAGYSKNTATEMAYENLSKPHIKAHIEESMREIHDKIGATIEWKAKMLKKCADRCMPTDESKRFMPVSMIASIAELNKMAGDYAATKTESSVNLSVDEDVQKAREISREIKKEY